MNQIHNITLNSFNQINQQLLSYPVSVAYMNIRSLRTGFTSLLTTINNTINKLTIIVLVETNITDNENDLYSINGFNSIFLNRGGNGGGIAVYIKDNIAFTTISLNVKSFEVIQIDLNFDNQIVSLLSIYRPPSSNIKEFLNEIDKTINTINKKQELIIVGDMNIDILKQNNITIKYIDMILSYGLQCVIKEVTREDINKNTRTCIDHLFVRNFKQTTHLHAAVIKTTISDHYSIFCCLESENQSTENNLVQGAKLNNFKVNQQIQQTNWNDIIQQNLNTNDLCNKINKIFCEIYEKSSKAFKTTKKRSPSPWISEELIKCCDIRDKLYKKWLNNRTNKTFENQYKQFRNSLNKKLNITKNNYYREKFIENRNDMRATWQIINEIIGKKIK